MKRHGKCMTNIVSALTARTQLGQIMKRTAQNNERFVIERRGQPSVIVMSIKDYIETIAPPPDWLKAIGAEGKERGLNKLTMRQIDAEVATARKERRRQAVSNPRK